MKTKNDKNSTTKEEEQGEKAGTVDVIKRKYGFYKAGVSIKCTFSAALSNMFN